jgi:hypothetical protein
MGIRMGTPLAKAKAPLLRAQFHQAKPGASTQRYGAGAIPLHELRKRRFHQNEAPQRRILVRKFEGGAMVRAGQLVVLTILLCSVLASGQPSTPAASPAPPVANRAAAGPAFDVKAAVDTHLAKTNEIHGYVENAPRFIQDGGSAVSQNRGQSAQGLKTVGRWS